MVLCIPQAFQKNEVPFYLSGLWKLKSGSLSDATLRKRRLGKNKRTGEEEEERKRRVNDCPYYYIFFIIIINFKSLIQHVFVSLYMSVVASLGSPDILGVEPPEAFTSSCSGSCNPLIPGDSRLEITDICTTESHGSYISVNMHMTDIFILAAC